MPCNDRNRVRDLVDPIGFAMLVTHGGGDELRTHRWASIARSGSER